MKLQILLPLLALVFGSGCASNYQRAWNNAAGKSAVIPSASGGATVVPARWSGTWLSEKSGHNGTLRCIVLPTENPDEIHTWFDSTYAKVLRFKMKSTFQTEADGQSSLRFSGSENLGWPFGEYQREGEIRGEVFESTYEAKSDHGVFEMRAAD